MDLQQDIHQLPLSSDSFKILDAKETPQIILLVSGKRKCGKDFVTDYLKSKLGDDECEILKISEPIKSHWAKKNNLNLNELLSDSQYKEQHRLDMIKWSEDVRRSDYGYFCRTACLKAVVKTVWIVSDVRRKTDIRWFKKTYGDLIKTVRIIADDETRVNRGFQFKEGVDDAPSECDLDYYNDWDLIVDNGDNKESLDIQLDNIIHLLKSTNVTKTNCDSK